MIDEQLLRTLGWEEDLIKEVSRSADSLRRDIPQTQTIEVADNSFFTVSGNEVFFDSGNQTRVISDSLKLKSS